MKKEALVSIIIPVYNVENTILKKCLDSIIQQTYKQIEIIIINDATNESNEEQIKEYVQKFNQIKELKHSENKGLFQARITGVQNAKGKYIAFVDADDYISIDWIRLLVQKAEKESADIVMANTICENESGLKFVYNASIDYLKDRECWKKEEIFRNLLEDEGRFFQLHTMWNKLYTKDLWNRAFVELKKCNEHLIMTEDILFSFILFYYAEKMAFSNHDGYFYYRNAQSSTYDTNGIKKVKKNVRDIISVFRKIEAFMDSKNLLEQYMINFDEWRNRYFRWWSPIVKGNTQDSDNDLQKQVRSDFLNYFGKEDFEMPIEEDDFFTLYTTKWDSGLETIKRKIVSEDIDVVSFDIFDTLILRPLLEPGDIFEIIQWENPVIGKYNFKKIRKISEDLCRKENGIYNPQIEDVTLDQIYFTMQKEIGLSEEIVEKLKTVEINTEIGMACERKIGKELYILANYVGKKIILVSDMYLSIETVNKILLKNGYNLHKKIYLSSREKVLKSTGRLFERVIADYPVETCGIVHIGDNWNSDFLIPSNKGITCFFLPKTKDILFNTLGDKYTGNGIGYAVKNTNSIIDLRSHLNKLPVRCFYAIIANCLFDNPFVPFNDNSDYNGDPYMIGNLAVGMHLFGIALWLIENLKNRSNSKIHFSSRDGFYLKKVYDLVRKEWYPSTIESNYVYISRKSLIPIDIQKEEDVLSLMERFEWRAQSPKSIFMVYQAVLNDFSQDEEIKYQKKGFEINNRFSSYEECLAFLKFLSKESFNKSKAERSKRSCEAYLRKNILKEDVFFDLGYSGKLQASIIKALGFSIDGYYVHDNGFETMRLEKDNGFKITSYYDFIPSMSGAVNEFILSDYHSSCIGYKLRNNSCIPVFESTRTNLINRYIVEEIHRGSMNFIKNILCQFSEHKDIFCVQPMDSSLQYEKFLMLEKEFDMQLFRCCKVEDEYYGGVSHDKLINIWRWQLGDRQLFVKSEPIYIERVVEKKDQDYQDYRELTELKSIYSDGVLVKTFNMINKKFPIGSKKRQFLKKIVGIFVK